MHAFWLVLTYDLLKDRRTDDVIIKTFFPYILIIYYIKQIDSKLVCVCSVIDHRGHQNVVRTKKWHTRRSRVCHWCHVIIKTFFNSLLYKTNRFQVAVRLFSNRSQMTSKCGKNRKVAHEAQLNIRPNWRDSTKYPSHQGRFMSEQNYLFRIASLSHKRQT